MRLWHGIAVVLMLGAPLWAAGPQKPLEPDGHTLVLSHLESAGDVSDPTMIRGGHPAIVGKSDETAFVEGRFGKGLLLKSGALEVPAAGGNFPDAVGTVEMYLKPTQPWKPWTTILLRSGGRWDGWGKNQIDVHLDKQAIVMDISGSPGSLKVTGKFDKWDVDQWRHVALCWDLPAGKAAIYIDGELAGQAEGKPVAMAASTKTMRIGFREPTNAVVDELRVSDVWRYPGSDNYQGPTIASPPADRALNEDGGFENCTLGTIAQPQPTWNKAEGNRDAAWELVGENPHAGKRCLKIGQPVANAGKAYVSTRQWWTPGTAGRTYSFTAWLRSDDTDVTAALLIGTSDGQYSRKVYVRPGRDWQRYVVTWALAKDQGTLLEAHVENRGRGSLFVDDAAISEGGQESPAGETFNVDAARELGTWADVNAGVDVAPTCWQAATFDPGTMTAFKTMGVKRVGYSIFCKSLGLVEKGEGQWDWRLVDRHMELFRQNGIQAMPCFQFTPPWLVSQKRKSGEDSKPKDYAKWGKLVSDVVRHLNVENKCGIEYFEFWNEPDFPMSWDGTPEELFKLYEVFVPAVKSVDPKAKVGGPGASSGNGEPLMKAFVKYCGEHKVPLDFLSFHYYGIEPSQIQLRGEEFRSWVMEYEALRDVPFYISEWNITGAQPDLTGRADTHVDGAYAAAWVAAAIDNGVALATVFDDKDGAWPKPGVLFRQDIGIFTADATPKPIANALQCWSMLDRMRIAAEGGTPDVGIFATRGDGAVNLLVWNYGGSGKDRTIKIANAPFEAGQVKVERYVVDAYHANANTVYKRLKPAKPVVPVFAEGAWGKIVEAAVAAKGDWGKSDPGYRGNAPAGTSAKLLTTSEPGATLSWDVDVPAEGKYFPWIKAEGNYYGGVCEALLDDKAIGQFDIFIAGLDMRWFGMPAQQLTAGKHTLSVRFTDEPGKFGWRHPRRMAAVDLLCLTNDASFAPTPLGGGADAQAGVNLKDAAALKVVDTSQVPAGKEIELTLRLTEHSVTLIRLSRGQ